MKKKVLMLLLMAMLCFSTTACSDDFWDDEETEDWGSDWDDDEKDDKEESDDEKDKDDKDASGEDKDQSDDKDDEENQDGQDSAESSDDASVKEDEQTEEPEEEDTRERLEFSTTDIQGNAYSSEDMKNAKVVMLNFWEPWCGPCVGEMPDIEELYEKYKDQGFLVIGAFSTEGMDSDVKAVMKQCGTTYPIIRSTDSMYKYMTEYVPTTVFLDGKGHVISDEPFVGSNSYSEWEKLIVKYLEEN